jgi:PEP-CTERM motif-containing protein
MRIWLKMILPIAFAAAAWSAPSACVAGTYASYQALVSGCTVGDEVFSNFTGLTFTNSLGVDTITPAELFITPSVVAGVDELLFTYQNLPTGFGGFPSSTDVGVGGSQIFSYSFQYIVTPSPNPLADIQMKSTILNTGSGSVSAVKDLDSNATESSANDGGGPHTSFTPVSGPITAVSFGGPYTVQDTISLQGQSGTAEQQDFTNLFTEGSVSTSTPEPSTTLLIATGLICFGITRRFRANS